MKSMTGFGRGEASKGGTTVRVEASSVNRKGSEVVAALPRELADLEPMVREVAAEFFSRGRVNVKVSLERSGSAGVDLAVDHDLAIAYDRAMRELARRLGRAIDLTATDLMRAPGVMALVDARVEPESCRPLLERALRQAFRALESMRRAEGAELRRDLEHRLADLERHVETVRGHAPEVVVRYRENLRRRLAESGVEIDLDDERIIKEIGLFADRCDISEELARLDSHLKQFRHFLRSREPSGRTMDFLAQEFFREFNTIGSKGSSAEIARTVVEAKTEIEKIREQVQNVE